MSPGVSGRREHPESAHRRACFGSSERSECNEFLRSEPFAAARVECLGSNDRPDPDAATAPTLPEPPAPAPATTRIRRRRITRSTIAIQKTTKLAMATPLTPDSEMFDGRVNCSPFTIVGGALLLGAAFAPALALALGELTTAAGAAAD